MTEMISRGENNDNDRRILFIMNPKAGTMQAARYLVDILQLFSDAGYLTTVMMTNKAGDGRVFAEKYAADADIVACAGGDGTLNEVISGVIASGSKCDIGYIPAGSTNDFAASVGLPRGIMDAAEVIVSGKPRTLDIGSFNGRMFSYVASFGAFTSTSYSVPQNIKNIMGHTAYVMQGIRDIINIKPVLAKFVADEGTPNERIFEGEYVFGAVCNSTSVGGLLKLDYFDIDMNDGMMEVLLIHSPANILEVNEIVRTMLDGTLDAPSIKLFSAKNIKVRIETGTHWTLDGEYEEGSTDIDIDTLRSAIKLIV